MNRQIEEANRICDEMREIASNQHNYGMLGNLDELKELLKGLSPQGGELLERPRSGSEVLVLGAVEEHDERGAIVVFNDGVAQLGKIHAPYSIIRAAHAPKEGWVNTGTVCTICGGDANGDKVCNDCFGSAYNVEGWAPTHEGEER